MNHPQEADAGGGVGGPAGDAGEAQIFVPSPPATVEETGLSSSFIEQLIVKTLYFQEDVIGRDLADALGLHFSVIAPMIELFRRRRLLDVKGSLGFGDVSTIFALSDAGRTRAREFLDDNQYVGPAPVPVSEYAEAVRRQRIPPGWLKRQDLAQAYAEMILPKDILSQLGLALNSRKSFLIYGKPGNGKTYVAQSISALSCPAVFTPYALEANGQIIQFLDPIYHQRVDGPGDWHHAGYDGRWARCKRPFIVTGGELTLERLDLGYSPTAKVYDAPLQLKANNGVYLIDDFGRQRASPAEVLNRWIVPMERRVDYLTFRTGEKIEVPFDTFLIFCTNLNPESLGDEAFLRRIEYKMLMKNPAPGEFSSIFQQVCASRGLECPAGLVARLLETHYRKTHRPLRRCHPRDIISHVADMLTFEGLTWELTEDVLDRAYLSCFVETSEDEAT